MADSEEMRLSESGMKTTEPKTKNPVTEERDVSVKLFERVFLPWTVILILAHLLTIYLAPAYMWGIHFYHFYPLWIGWIATLVTLTVLIPGVGELLYFRFEALVKKIRKPFNSLSQNKSFLILSFISLPVFWLFRNRLHLLGDGYFRITELPTGRLHLQEWLDAFIHLVVYRVTIKLIPTWSVELTYSIISVLCGGVFVFLALKLSALLGKTGLGKVLIFFSLISLGSVQLFFGYVESYSILQVVLLAYILFSAMYLLRKVNVFPVLVTFVISIGLHVTSLVFAPSFIYLLTKRDKARSRKKESVTKTISNAFMLVGLIVASFLVVSWTIIVAIGLEKTGKGIFLLPLKATGGYSFTMFSLAHISEFVNQLLLLSPLGISLIVFFLFFRIKFRRFDDKLLNFLILATSFALLYLFVFNFTLGSADWDLRSMPAPFIGLLGILLFLRWGERPSTVHSPQSTEQSDSDTDVSSSRQVSSIGSPMGKRFFTWGVIFIWFGLFHTLPWVLINAHHQRSVDRYVLIQENDPHPVDETGYNLYKIARILESAGLQEEMKHVYQRAVEKNPDDMVSYYNLANWYHRQGDFDHAMLILDTLLKINPAHPLGNWLAGKIYISRDEYAIALPYLEKVLSVLGNNPDFLYELAFVYYSTYQPEKAITCARKIIDLKPGYLQAYHLLGLTYTKLGDLEEAGKVWEHILTIDPGDPIAIKNLEEIRMLPKNK
jgi:Flp pilus assembly protein TadD